MIPRQEGGIRGAKVGGTLSADTPGINAKDRLRASPGAARPASTTPRGKKEQGQTNGEPEEGRGVV